MLPISNSFWQPLNKIFGYLVSEFLRGWDYIVWFLANLGTILQNIWSLWYRGLSLCKNKNSKEIESKISSSMVYFVLETRERFENVQSAFWQDFLQNSETLIFLALKTNSFYHFTTNHIRMVCQIIICQKYIMFWKMQSYAKSGNSIAFLKSLRLSK